jgi:hypothetical protein
MNHNRPVNAEEERRNITLREKMDTYSIISKIIRQHKPLQKEVSKY